MKGWMRAAALVLAMMALGVGDVRAGGDRLPTDEAVRKEMTAVRKLTLDAHTLVTHRRMPPADARTFHARIKAAVERIGAETTLDGAVRDEIDALAQDILGGAAAVAGLDEAVTPIDGIVAIDEALSRYAKRFDHPDWKPLR